jgi:hypothetical protein
MDNLIKRYRGRITGQGHEVVVKNEQDKITIGFKHSGEYEDQYDPFVHVAWIEHIDGAYRIGWFHDDAEEPTDEGEYTRAEDLCAALDQAIEQRSKEAGRSDG